MHTEAVAEITVRELIGQMIRARKEKVGGTTTEFEAFVVEKELPVIVSRMSKHLSAKRVHKLEGLFLGLTDRPSEMVAAVVTHDTSRALDPQLHTHVCVMNVTFDPVEKRWKVVEPHGYYKYQSYLREVSYNKLAEKMKDGGYPFHGDPYSLGPDDA